MNRSRSFRQRSACLSSITEEDILTSPIENPKIIIKRSTSLNVIRNSSLSLSQYLTPNEKRLALIKSDSLNEKLHLLPKQSFQQAIARTSDNRLPIQHNAYSINQQKRLVEHKLKQVFH